MSTVDSELKPQRSRIPELSGRAVFWWASLFAGLSVVVTENPQSIFLVHPHWQVAIGASMLLVSSVGLLHHYAVVNVRLLWSPRRAQIRERLDVYCKKGEELYLRLAGDPTIRSANTHHLVTDTWVNPVADYLRGTLGDRRAKYFLSIQREPAPDKVSIQQFGYSKALARDRIKVRLERLRQIASDV